MVVLALIMAAASCLFVISYTTTTNVRESLLAMAEVGVDNAVCFYPLFLPKRNFWASPSWKTTGFFFSFFFAQGPCFDQKKSFFIQFVVCCTIPPTVSSTLPFCSSTVYCVSYLLRCVCPTSVSHHVLLFLLSEMARRFECFVGLYPG